MQEVACSNHVTPTMPKKIIFSRKRLESIVKSSKSLSECSRKLGFKSRSSSVVVRNSIDGLGISRTHFVEGCHKRPNSYYLANSKKVCGKRLRKLLLAEGVEYKCKLCGNPGSWAGRPLRLQVDHINGDTQNNTLENLRWLCPNCHDQTPTWGKRKK